MSNYNHLFYNHAQKLKLSCRLGSVEAVRSLPGNPSNVVFSLHGTPDVYVIAEWYHGKTPYHQTIDWDTFLELTVDDVDKLCNIVIYNNHSLKQYKREIKEMRKAQKEKIVSILMGLEITV